MQRPSSIFKKRIAARFDRASGSYESEACVQIEIAKRVANLIRSENGAESPKNQLWCDFGSGSGTLLEQLKENLPGNTQFVCLDLSF
ncbi:MAG: class I SAM-dependent methyltransferase, partial [Chitinispirillales bacterium]|nr:class I SAM-dependent methyltransferase [Chitinispirillales bacterium]